MVEYSRGPEAMIH